MRAGVSATASLFVTPPPARDLQVTLGRLIRLATGSEGSRPLVDAAWQELGRPLAVVDATGTAVAAAPMNGGADAAMRVARTCAAGPADPPPGWVARALQQDDRTVGWLVVHRADVGGEDDEAVLGALSDLLAAQLGRAALQRSVVAQRREAIRERLLTDPGSDPAGLIAEAESLGVHLAPVYWASLVVWRQAEVSPVTLEAAEYDWQAEAPLGSFSLFVDGALVLLYADKRPGTLLAPEVELSVKRTVAILARQRPSLDAHGIVAEQSVPIARLCAQVHLLRQLRPYATRPTAGSPVLPVRRFALDRLLEGVNPARGRAFVGQCVGPLLAYDERHGSDLASTLELALKYPRRDDAARAAFMHRNTFRRRLQQALELIDADLDDPDQRLALHVALKLHRRPEPGTSAVRPVDRGERPRVAPLRTSGPRARTGAATAERGPRDDAGR